MVHMLKPYNCSHCGFKDKDKRTFYKHYILHRCPNEKQKAVHSEQLQRDLGITEENSEISSNAETDTLDTTDNSTFHSNQRAQSAEVNKLTHVHPTELAEARGSEP